jgi:hypothetical protein
VYEIAALAALWGVGGTSGIAVASSGSASPAAAATGRAGAAKVPEPVQVLDIKATEYSFEITPDPSAGLQPGWTLLKFHNIGSEAHQAMFAQLKDGVDLAELSAAGAGDSSGASAIAFVNMVGGVSYIGPGQDTTAMVNLVPGIALAMCYVPNADGVAHALLGMTKLLTVAEPSGDTAPPTAEPGTKKPGSKKVVGTIELAKDGYQIPDNLRKGWYHVKNTDTLLHEMALLRLGRSLPAKQTKTLVEDLAANKATKVTTEALGGIGATAAGFDGYLYLDLPKGDYLAVDFMPDPGVPRPHMLDGYYARFST